MLNPKTLKLIANLTTMLVGSVLLGTIYKAEKEVHQKIDDHFAPEKKAKKN